MNRLEVKTVGSVRMGLANVGFSQRGLKGWAIMVGAEERLVEESVCAGPKRSVAQVAIEVQDGRRAFILISLPVT